MSVKLRQRESGSKVILYLDIYHKGVRKTEYLKDLYLVPKPDKGRLTRDQNEHNRSTLEIAEEVRYQREVELRNSNYNIKDFTKGKVRFLDYVQKILNTRSQSVGNYGNWLSVYKHLEAYCEPNLLLADIDIDWLQGFKKWLENGSRRKGQSKLSVNSQGSYFSKVKVALKEAYKEGLIAKNIGDMVESVKPQETERNFLTLKELEAVSSVECSIPVLKNAFIFSCLTGLRWSDIEKLTWGEVHEVKPKEYVIRFRMQKTKAFENHPIAPQAYKLLGKRGKPNERVFEGLYYSAWNNLKLQQWVMKAGITKNITFHCARHTYATLQISLGTDVYTLSSLLGHKNLKNTQIYAKIMDEQKMIAANRLNIEL